MKIYNSEGEIEYTKEECTILLNFLRRANMMLADSLEDLIKTSEGKNIN